MIANTNFTQIGRGERYPLPILGLEGAKANFLTKSGSILQIGMRDIARSEEMAIRKGPMKAGLISEGPLILWVFTFGSIIMDCPFDARLIPRDRLELPDIISDQQRLHIQVHLVDTATDLVRGLRSITFSPALTRSFLIAVQDQLSDKRAQAPYLVRYNQVPMARLLTLAQVERCGT